MNDMAVSMVERIKDIYNSSISKRNKRFFSVAATLAETSEFYQFKLGAVAVVNHTIVGQGVNSNKTHPMQDKYNKYRKNFNRENMGVTAKIHAEIACLANINQNVDCKGGEVYIFRRCNNRPHGNARPCPACMKAIKDKGFKKIHYTTDDGFATEFIS